MTSHLLIRGNALRLPLADESVHMAVCSPPYWGLRSYGHWWMQTCFGDIRHFSPPRRNQERWWHRLQWRAAERGGIFSPNRKAWIGALGLEPTPDQFVSNMVAVFREVRRVLRLDGSCWVNLGDSYSGERWTNSVGTSLNARGKNAEWSSLAATRVTDLQPKNLVGIPWRVALALQADGWWLRSDIIWAKPNPMPESVTDRPTKSHEYMFLLTTSDRYYFDAEAVREPHKPSTQEYFDRYDAKPVCITERTKQLRATGIGHTRVGAGSRCEVTSRMNPSGRNLRTVWNIPTESYPGAHFATYPRRLIEPCIKAGTSEKGCCPECGKGWEREQERGEAVPLTPSDRGRKSTWTIGDAARNPSTRTDTCLSRHYRPVLSTVWHSACNHGHDPVPCVVLDPFIGSGTSIVVANALGRHGIGVDLSQEYLHKNAKQRIERPHARVPRPGKKEHLPLFEGIDDDT